MAKQDVIVRLHPSRTTIEWNINAADNVPSDLIETTHEISSVDIGPEVSGVSSDIHSGNTGAIQPKLNPWDSNIRFAVEKK